MWNGAQPRVVFAIDPQLQLQPDANEPSWRFSPDGAHCVLWTQTSFSVRETASGATLVTREVDSKGTPAVWAVAFPPGRIRAFLATGDLVDVDLGARSVSKRASFGRPGKYSRNWLQEGASWEGRYSALLSPDGRYVAIYKRDTGYEIYLTD
jgi:hypothetical protein